MNHNPKFLALVRSVMPFIQEIGVREAYVEKNKTTNAPVILLDVREDSEWLAGHAPKAIHISRGILEREIEVRIPDPKTTIFCYCGVGFRSALAVDNLRKMGYSKAFSVVGGFSAWKENQLPVSTAPEICPRSPHEKLAGIFHLPRLIDKARLFPQGKLPGYTYLTHGFDKTLLDLLCIDEGTFERIVNQCPDDDAVLLEIKRSLGESWPPENTINEFNEKILSRRPDTKEKVADFKRRIAAVPSTPKRIETYFDLIDLEEERL